MSKLPYKHPVFNRHVWAQQEWKRQLAEYAQEAKWKQQADEINIAGVIMWAIAVVFIAYQVYWAMK